MLGPLIDRSWKIKGARRNIKSRLSREYCHFLWASVINRTIGTVMRIHTWLSEVNCIYTLLSINPYCVRCYPEINLRYLVIRFVAKGWMARCRKCESKFNCIIRYRTMVNPVSHRLNSNFNLYFRFWLIIKCRCKIIWFCDYVTLFLSTSNSYKYKKKKK